MFTTENGSSVVVAADKCTTNASANGGTDVTGTDDRANKVTDGDSFVQANKETFNTSAVSW
jgi:hypothetical protein